MRGTTDGRARRANTSSPWRKIAFVRRRGGRHAFRTRSIGGVHDVGDVVEARIGGEGFMRDSSSRSMTSATDRSTASRVAPVTRISATAASPAMWAMRAFGTSGRVPRTLRPDCPYGEPSRRIVRPRHRRRRRRACRDGRRVYVRRAKLAARSTNARYESRAAIDDWR